MSCEQDAYLKPDPLPSLDLNPEEAQAAQRNGQVVSLDKETPITSDFTATRTAALPARTLDMEEMP